MAWPHSKTTKKKHSQASPDVELPFRRKVGRPKHEAIIPSREASHEHNTTGSN